MIYFTSDLHFGHRNILNLCKNIRGQYKDIDDMREKMILEWNQIITDEDTVYILGDFCFSKYHNAVNILQRLKGYKVLIAGNHDEHLITHKSFQDCFVDIHSYYELHHDNQMYVLSHYPIPFWNRQGKGSIMLHGHMHGSKPMIFPGRIMDVGYDATGNIVTSIDTINKIMDDIEYGFDRHHQ